MKVCTTIIELNSFNSPLTLAVFWLNYWKRSVFDNFECFLQYLRSFWTKKILILFPLKVTQTNIALYMCQHFHKVYLKLLLIAFLKYYKKPDLYRNVALDGNNHCQKEKWQLSRDNAFLILELLAKKLEVIQNILLPIALSVYLSGVKSGNDVYCQGDSKVLQQVLVIKSTSIYQVYIMYHLDRISTSGSVKSKYLKNFQIGWDNSLVLSFHSKKDFF